MRKLIAILFVLMLGAGASAVLAGGNGNNGNGNFQPVTLCHWAGNPDGSNGHFESITVSTQGEYNGHTHHSLDIIPAPAGGCPVATPEPTEEPTTVTDTPTEEVTPVVTPTDTPVVTDEPTDNPVVTDEPPVVTEEPPVVTEEPPVVTDEPTDNPVVTDEPTDNPVVTDEPPVVTEEPPVVTEEPPVVTDEPTDNPTPEETQQPPVGTPPPTHTVSNVSQPAFVPGADQIGVWSNVPAGGVGWLINGSIVVDDSGVAVKTETEYRNRWNNAIQAYEENVPFSRLTLGFNNKDVNPDDYRAFDYDRYVATGEIVIVGVWVEYQDEHAQPEDFGSAAHPGVSVNLITNERYEYGVKVR